MKTSIISHYGLILICFAKSIFLPFLAWLDQANYEGAVEIHMVGDKFQPKDSFNLKVKGYDAIYNQVLIQKNMPKAVLPAPFKRGIELYLNYLDKESDLIRYIKEHLDVSEEELVRKLIMDFQHYGLGDTQYLEIIRSYRKK